MRAVLIFLSGALAAWLLFVFVKKPAGELRSKGTDAAVFGVQHTYGEAARTLAGSIGIEIPQNGLDCFYSIGGLNPVIEFVAFTVPKDKLWSSVTAITGRNKSEFRVSCRAKGPELLGEECRTLLYDLSCILSPLAVDWTLKSGLPAECVVDEVLRSIPFIKEIRFEKSLVPDFHDGWVDFRVGPKSFRWLIQVEQEAPPRVVRHAPIFLGHAQIKNRADYSVLISRYISPQSAKICEEQNLGYLDFAGNCHLCFESVYIHQEGKPNPFVTRREQQSLFHTKSERILRVLLDPAHAGRHWSMRELSVSAEPKVSLGQVHKVVHRLLDDEYLRETASGLILQNPVGLIESWAKAYRFKRNQVDRMFSLERPEKLKESLMSLARKSGTPFAWASFTAAEELAPHVRQPRLYCYLPGGGTSLPKELEVKFVESGENVIVMDPYDEGVFHGVTNSRGTTGPVQTYLDLSQSGGRGAEAAEAILEQILKRAWKKDRR